MISGSFEGSGSTERRQEKKYAEILYGHQTELLKPEEQGGEDGGNGSRVNINARVNTV